MIRPQRTIIIDTPPTSNGDLHIGHLAGPFMAADVYARHLRGVGEPVVFASGTDDGQTYVLASARRQGIKPEELCARSRMAIERTLGEFGISLDGFAPYDDAYRGAVLDFIETLYRAGEFELRTVRLPQSSRTGEFLVEGLVCGYCPVCLVESRGGLCESCGHPNNFDELIEPRSTVDAGDALTIAEAEILVLPMESYRAQLVDFYRDCGQHMRPHAVELVFEALDRPLPDFPITYPISWGIPAPFVETPGQVLNAWAEGIPAVMFCSFVAAQQLGERPTRYDELWLSDSGSDVVYFIGFDNVYFWGMTHVALLMAHRGRYVLPSRIVSNEFYEFENRKFSTSSGHVIHSSDVMREMPRDVLRFYLALTSPDHQTTNFDRTALREITEDRLVAPWHEFSAAVNDAVESTGVVGTRLPVSAAAHSRASILTQRFSQYFQVDTFSLPRAAEYLVAQLRRLRTSAESALASTSAERRPGLIGDLLYEASTLTSAASPILIDLSVEVLRASGRQRSEVPDGSFGVDQVGFLLPQFVRGTRNTKGTRDDDDRGVRTSDGASVGPGR